MRIVICSGGFDPLHSGHIKLLEAAAQLGDKLFVGVNSDAWLVRKKGQPFMPFEERVNIVGNLKMVDEAFGFDDDDGSAVNTIRHVSDLWPYADIVFANGGDRNSGNIPEMEAFADNSRIEFEFGVGGDDKANSSSWILSEWKSPRTERPWGYYRNLHQDGPGTKVKELTVNPGAELSMQRHRLRSEVWMVTHGRATVILGPNDPKTTETRYVGRHEILNIQRGVWHKLINETDEPLRIVEIQYGVNCAEEDIERVGVDENYGASLYAK